MLSSKGCNCNVKSESIDTTKTIASVSVLEAFDQFYGLRFTDDTGAIIYEQSWCKNEVIQNHSDGWVTKEIPKGWHIVGVRCNT